LARDVCFGRVAQGVQWNPADDACLAGELFTARSDEWRLGGQLFELEARNFR